MADIAWVDAVMLGIVALSALVGLWRGLVFELMSLAGWVVAYVVAQACAADVAGYLAVGAAGSALRHAVAFGLTFVAALVVWALLARLVRMAVQATPLTLPDRALGAGFGLLRGLVVLLAIATVVAFTPAVRSSAWAESRAAHWLGALLQGLKPLLPDDLARHLPA
jgi:membrane protein required for colicin V production